MFTLKPRFLVVLFFQMLFSSTCFSSQFILSAVNGDGCVPGYVYDRVFTPAEVRSKYHKNAKAFIHDNCSAGDELIIGINGKSQALSRVIKAVGSGEIDDGHPFSDANTVVVIQRIRLIAQLKDSSEKCGGSWWIVKVTVASDGEKKVVNGTLAHSC